MSYTIEIPKININLSQEQIPYLQPQQAQILHRTMLQNEMVISNNLNHEFKIIEKIEKINEETRDINREIDIVSKRERKIINRIAYVCAGVGCAIFCPISWIAGTVASLFLAFAGGGAIGMAFPLFVTPIKTCDMLFKKAFYSSNSWESEKRVMQETLTATQNELKKFHTTYIQRYAKNLDDKKNEVRIPNMQREIVEILNVVRKIQTDFRM